MSSETPNPSLPAGGATPAVFDLRASQATYRKGFNTGATLVAVVVVLVGTGASLIVLALQEWSPSAVVALAFGAILVAFGLVVASALRPRAIRAADRLEVTDEGLALTQDGHELARGLWNSPELAVELFDYGSLRNPTTRERASVTGTLRIGPIVAGVEARVLAYVLAAARAHGAPVLEDPPTKRGVRVTRIGRGFSP